MPKHPTKVALEALLLGTLARAERNAVVAHLVKGCPRCRRALTPLGEALFATSPPTAPDGGWRYELAVRRAIRRALSVELPAGDRGVPRAGRLLWVSAKLRNARRISECADSW